jgi:mRNA interferase HicA
LKRRELLAHLSAHGWTLLRESAKHSWLANPAMNRRAAVPRHKEIANLLAKKICRDLGVPEP